MRTRYTIKDIMDKRKELKLHFMISGEQITEVNLIKLFLVKKYNYEIPIQLYRTKPSVYKVAHAMIKPVLTGMSLPNIKECAVELAQKINQRLVFKYQKTMERKSDRIYPLPKDAYVKFWVDKTAYISNDLNYVLESAILSKRLETFPEEFLGGKYNGSYQLKEKGE